MKKRQETPMILPPTETQIENCERFGWEHLGEGIFEHKESGMMGYFSPRGFEKEG